MFGPAELALHRADVDDLAAAARDHAGAPPPGRRGTRCRRWCASARASRASSNSSSGARRCMPALLTRMSMAPMSRSMRVDGRRDRRRPRSRRRRRRAPWRLRSRSARAACSSLAVAARVQHHASRRRRPGRRASAKPMPALEPVTSAMRAAQVEELQGGVHGAFSLGIRWASNIPVHRARLRCAAPAPQFDGGIARRADPCRWRCHPPVPDSAEPADQRSQVHA